MTIIYFHQSLVIVVSKMTGNHFQMFVLPFVYILASTVAKSLHRQPHTSMFFRTAGAQCLEAAKARNGTKRLCIIRRQKRNTVNRTRDVFHVQYSQFLTGIRYRRAEDASNVVCHAVELHLGPRMGQQSQQSTSDIRHKHLEMNCWVVINGFIFQYGTLVQYL